MRQHGHLQHGRSPSAASDAKDELHFADMLIGDVSACTACKRFWAWLARQSLLLSLPFTALASCGFASQAVLGIWPGAAIFSPIAMLLIVLVLSCGVLSVLLLFATTLHGCACDRMLCLAPCLRLALLATVVGSWCILPFASSALILATGKTLRLATLAELRLACQPRRAGPQGSLWEHGCGGVTHVELNEGLVLEELDTHVDAWPYRLYVAPVSDAEVSHRIDDYTRETLHAYLLRWWPSVAEFEAAEVSTVTFFPEPEEPASAAAEQKSTESLMNVSIAPSFRAALLWGDLGPAVRALEQAFPGQGPVPLMIEQSAADEIVAHGWPFLRFSGALLMAHGALVCTILVTSEVEGTANAKDVTVRRQRARAKRGAYLNVLASEEDPPCASDDQQALL